MRIEAFLAQAVQRLQAAGIQTARLDVLILLEYELGVERAQLLAHPGQTLAGTNLKHLNIAVSRRVKHEPLAYIRGKAAFFGRVFLVDEHVLVPRPESEAIVELLLRHVPTTEPNILDVGTGSGCLGISAALELPKSNVTLSDISDDALAVARQNAQSLKAKNVAFVNANLATPCQSQHFDVVLANLPYVPEHFPINKAAGFEPPLALFSGADGLDAYRTFWQQLANAPQKPTLVIAESLPSQHHALATLARSASYALEQAQDFVQLFVRM